MASFFFFSCLLTLLGVVCCKYQEQSNDKSFVPEAILSKLSKTIQESQIYDDSSPPPFAAVPGLYPAYTKRNFNGEPGLAFWRRMQLYDTSMFGTYFINAIILEASQRGAAPSPLSLQLTKAIELLPRYVDRNRHFENSINVYDMMEYNNETDFWLPSPPNSNIEAMSGTFLQGGMDMFEALDKLGFPEFGENLRLISKHRGYSAKFPGDLDCSSINLAFGAALYQDRDRYPSAWQQWKNINTNLSSVFDAYKEYSYRPFSGIADNNQVASRSYYAYRYFLDEAKDEGKDVALVMTWTQSPSQMSWQYEKGMSIPTNVNDLCIGVIADSVYGITSSILSGLVDVSVLDDPLVAQIYHNSSEVLAYMLETDFSGRLDLVTVYYPSRYEVEWFTSRSLVKLEDASRKKQLTSPVMESIHRRLKEVFRSDVTQRLIRDAHRDTDTSIFYEDFLGTDDVSEDGKPMKTGEDRIFATSLALNVFINSWTFSDNGRLFWDDDTPSTVKETASRAANWLVQNTFSGKYKPGGAFYGVYYEVPDWECPANAYYFYNGTEITDWSYEPNSLTSVAMQGYIEPTDYAAMLEKEWFGKTIPDFQSFNDRYFFYEESPPMTYALTLLALSQYRNIEE